MLVDKIGNVIHAVVDDDVETALGGVVAGHVGGGELLVGHCCLVLFVIRGWSDDAVLRM